MKYILAIGFLISISVCRGQSDIDSLEFLAENYSGRDTVRVNILNQLGYEYWIVNPVKSEEFGLEALEMAKEQEYVPGQAFANRVIGVAHWARGNYDLALLYLIASLSKYESLGDSIGQGNALMNIGLVYSDRFDREKSLEYFERAMGLFEATGKLERLATTYTKVGTLYLEDEKYEKAYDFLVRALQIHQQNDFSYGIAETNNRLGELFSRRGEYDKARDYLSASLALSHKINDREGLTRNYQDMGNLYLTLSQPDSAQKAYNQALTLAGEIGSKKRLRDAYFGLKEVYEQKGNYKEALFYANRYENMKDSVFNTEMANRIAHLQTEIEVLEKNKELELQDTRIKALEEASHLNRIIRWVLIILVVSLVILAWLIVKYQRQKIRMSALHQEKLEKQLDFKNKELASYTMNFIQKNEFLEELKERVTDLGKDAQAPEMRHKLAGIGRMIENAGSIDRDWEKFRVHFEQVHEGFLERLKTTFPELTGSDLKLCALIRLNLSMKESSALLGISPESVKTARYRLRKKLNIEGGENLQEFLMKFR